MFCRTVLTGSQAPYDRVTAFVRPGRSPPRTNPVQNHPSAAVPDVVVACVCVALGSIIVIIISSIAAVVVIGLVHGLLSGAPGMDVVVVVIVASIL